MQTRRLFALLGFLSIGAVALTSSAQPQPLTVETVALAKSKALRVKGDSVFLYRGEFQIDADGAPQAYHPGYTCDASYKKGWKHTTKLDCSARSTQQCSAKGFRDDPAPGTEGTFVRCGTVKQNGRWVCGETSSKKETQGGCTQDATANSGLDYLANAGYPGHFYGILTDKDDTGTPYVQGPSDPAPGYYISGTSLVNCNKPSPSCYVDSSKFNYIALPPSAMKNLGVKKGDFAMVVNWKNGKMAGAIFADTGNDYDDTLGEGSIALAAELGVAGTPKGGGQREDIVYIVFPGSTKGFPTDPKMVALNANLEFAKWGGPIKLMQVVPKEWAAQYKKN